MQYLLSGSRCLLITLPFLLTAAAPARSPLPQGCPTDPLPPASAPGDAFGDSVAVDGEFLLVASPGDDGLAQNAGVVHAFRIDASSGTWQHEQRIEVSDGAALDQLGAGTDGRALALAAGRFVVGSSRHDAVGAESGAVWVFRREPSGVWVEEQKLVAPDAAAFDRFGSQIALSADTLAVAAEGDNNAGGSDAGAVYVFRLDPGLGRFVFEDKLTAGDATQGDRLGRSVALHGDRILAGAVGASVGGSIGAGAVYVFERGPGAAGWGETQKLTAGDASAGSFFGYAAALTADIALIGAPGESSAGSLAGATYVFERSPGGAWLETHKQAAPQPSPSALFGSSVAFDGFLAVSAARGDDSLQPDAGVVYLHQRDPVSGAWSFLMELRDFTPESDDQFGEALSLAAGRLAVGAPLDSGRGHHAGATFTYERPMFDANGNGLPDACDPIGDVLCSPSVPNSSGLSARIRASGSTTAAMNLLTLTASALPPDEFGYFLCSRAGDLVQPPGSRGRLCLGGTIGRFSSDILHSGPLGRFALSVDLTALPFTPAIPVLPGDTWRFQGWFRDQDPATTSNFTDAVRVIYQ